MPNYQNGKIYKIVGNGLTYYGSTCKPLHRRLSSHVCAQKAFTDGRSTNYLTSFKCIENNNDYEIVLVEVFPCDTKEELLARERHFIENNVCVNKIIAGRSRQEYYADMKDDILVYQKVYYEDNKDKVLIRTQKYRENNKDIIKEGKQVYYENNKELVSERGKDYRRRNDAKIKEFKNAECLCDICGSSYTHSNKKRHERSAKHQNAINK